MAGGTEDEDITEEFNLPNMNEILEYDKKGNTARDRGEYDKAIKFYNEALEAAENYLDSIDGVREDQDLSEEQRRELNMREEGLEQYRLMLDDQIDQITPDTDLDSPESPS